MKGWKQIKYSRKFKLKPGDKVKAKEVVFMPFVITEIIKLWNDHEKETWIQTKSGHVVPAWKLEKVEW